MPEPPGGGAPPERRGGALAPAPASAWGELCVISEAWLSRGRQEMPACCAELGGTDPEVPSDLHDPVAVLFPVTNQGLL